jgi:hypothetical protein
MGIFKIIKASYAPPWSHPVPLQLRSSAQEMILRMKNISGNSADLGPSHRISREFAVFHYPIGSMYGIYANIGGILMVNVTILYHIYSIHGSYGYHKIEQTGIPKQQK